MFKKIISWYKENSSLRVLFLLTLFISFLFVTNSIAFYIQSFFYISWIRYLYFFLFMLFLLIVFLLFFRLKTISEFLDNRYLPILTFIFISLLLRIPWYVRVFDVEDSQIADVFFNWPNAPDFWLQGQFGGEKIYLPFYHPTAPLYILASFGRLIRMFCNPLDYDDLYISSYVRFLFSLPLLMVFSLLLIRLKKHLNRTQTLNKDEVGFFPLVVFVIFSTSQFALETSAYELHIDSTVGVLFSGFLTFALLYIDSENGKNLKLIFLFLSCFLYGLGKNEWTIILLATFTTTFFHLLLTKNIKGISGYLWCAIFGLFIGNIVSYFIDPFNYKSGIYLIIDVLQRTSFIPKLFDVPARHAIILLKDEHAGFDFWMHGLRHHYLHLIPLVLLLVLNSIVLLKNLKKMAFTPLFLYYFSLLFFIAFLISTWGIHSMRYFTPSFIPMIAFTTFYFSKYGWGSIQKRTTFYVTCFVTVLLAIRAYSLKINLKKTHESDYYINAIKGEKFDTSCLNSLRVTINKGKNIDYYMLIGAEATAKKYSLKNNIPLCK